ncbi:DUF3750 domain-containing protein [Halomonas sp. EGI 63088]|uniref:DUF3750 domain-containing protein n=1 Tax=Halomonas flagellata TaxID=2920385 RepID=A0ABS9RPD8_9GAMM|nr:DUF3750 domain-containing protein [Halomonas flagellata]MCH4561854.1 DUF3750 domain-containing protein [Halomonas flagellata]
MRRILRLAAGLGLVLALLLAGPLWMLATERVDGGGHWASASREPAGLAPTAAEAPAAVVQVYAARTWGWRGAFGVHTWIATREAGAEAYRLHHVLSWRRPALVSQSTTTPDRVWYGNAPVLLADYRGEAAAAMIGEIEVAVAAYPAPLRYRAWPGPNSNSFTAWVAREVPGLEVVFPVTAVGKDYLFDGVLASAPGGRGTTASLGGVLGVTLGRDEGLELNLLGLTLGVDVRRPALKLPGVGRLGMAAVIKGEGER